MLLVSKYFAGFSPTSYQIGVSLPTETVFDPRIPFEANTRQVPAPQVWAGSENVESAVANTTPGGIAQVH